VLTGFAEAGTYFMDTSMAGQIRDNLDMLSLFANSEGGNFQKKAVNHLSRLAQSYAIPLAGAQRSWFEKGSKEGAVIRKQEDPKKVGIAKTFTSQLPWNYSTREPVLRWDGEEVRRVGGPLGRMADPVGLFNAPTDGVQQRIIDEVGTEGVPGAVDTQANFKEKGRVIQLTRDQQFRMRKEVGRERAKRIDKLLKDSRFQGMSKEEKGAAIKEKSKEATHEIHEKWKQKLKRR
jgi:hypothetical protein